MKKLLIAAALLALVGFGCAKAPVATNVAVSEGGKSYDNAQYGISLTLPRDVEMRQREDAVRKTKYLGLDVDFFASLRDLVRDAHRFRKMLGGGMRQVGVLAAAALHALDHNVARVAEDHANARALAEAIGAAPEARVAPVETNIVNVDVPGVPAALVVAAAARRGVRIGASGPERVRLVTHLDVPTAAIGPAAAAICEALREAASVAGGAR